MIKLYKSKIITNNNTLTVIVRVGDIDKIEELLLQIDNVPEAEKRKKMASIMGNLKRCLQYGKEKVHIASSSYDLVSSILELYDDVYLCSSTPPSRYFDVASDF